LSDESNGLSSTYYTTIEVTYLKDIASDAVDSLLSTLSKNNSLGLLNKLEELMLTASIYSLSKSGVLKI
jgi:hypothetical protein